MRRVAGLLLARGDGGVLFSKTQVPDLAAQRLFNFGGKLPTRQFFKDESDPSVMNMELRYLQCIQATLVAVERRNALRGRLGRSQQSAVPSGTEDGTNERAPAPPGMLGSFLVTTLQKKLPPDAGHRTPC